MSMKRAHILTLNSIRTEIWHILQSTQKFGIWSELAIRKKHIPPHRSSQENNGYSAGNYLFLDEECNGGTEFRWALPTP
jgi:hypothetical protein